MAVVLASSFVVTHPTAHRAPAFKVSSAPVMGLFDFMTKSGGDGSSNDEAAPVPDGMARVWHLLLTTDGADELADAIKARIDAGETTFSDAAYKYSECRSKGKRGLLGVIQAPTQAMPLALGRVWNLPYEGKQVPEFDKLVFYEADVGQVYKVQTEFGTHLLKVSARGKPTSTEPGIGA